MIKKINVSVSILIIDTFLYIDLSNFVFVPSYTEALEIMLYDHTKDMTFSLLSIRELVPRTYPVSTHTSIRVNSVQCSVTTWFPSFKRIILIKFP